MTPEAAREILRILDHLDDESVVRLKQQVDSHGIDWTDGSQVEPGPKSFYNTLLYDAIGEMPPQISPLDTLYELIGLQQPEEATIYQLQFDFYDRADEFRSALLDMIEQRLREGENDWLHD